MVVMIKMWVNLRTECMGMRTPERHGKGTLCFKTWLVAPTFGFPPKSLGISRTQLNKYPSGRWNASETPRELFETCGPRASLPLRFLFSKSMGFWHGRLFWNSSHSGLGRFKPLLISVTSWTYILIFFSFFKSKATFM